MDHADFGASACGGNPLSSASPMEPASAVSTKGFDQAPGESARHFIIMDALGLLPPTLARTATQRKEATMSDHRFLQDGFDKRLAHLIEECGEVLSASGKLQRWGAHSVNPLLPESEQETNLAWLRREIADLSQAIGRLNEAIEQEFG